jgi:membrane protein implicated in regulation of membrane protease activity
MWTWLVLAGILLALEMMTGTLALLFAGAGALAAAALAYAMPDSLALQIIVFALATVSGTVLAWRRLLARKAGPGAAESAGQLVVAAGPADAQGQLRVKYRGSEWPARLAGAVTEVKAGETLVLLAQEGSLLVVGRMERKED